MEILYPVIMQIPQGMLPERPRNRNAELSRLARKALQDSAERSGAGSPAFAKDDRGVPVPNDGWHWSVTHKPEYVGGVVAKQPVGIDLEEVRTCSDALIRKTADDAEWKFLRHEDRNLCFIRIWTAKEAVLKAEGIGIRGLNECKIMSASADGLLVRGPRQIWTVSHVYLDRHIAAIAGKTAGVSWHVENIPSSDTHRLHNPGKKLKIIEDE